MFFYFFEIYCFTGIQGDFVVQPYYQVVFVRHGQSEYGESNLFTGWADSDVSNKGECQANIMAKTLKKEGFVFDLAYTSYLKRSIKTCHTILDQMDLHWIHVYK